MLRRGLLSATGAAFATSRVRRGASPRRRAASTPEEVSASSSLTASPATTPTPTPHKAPRPWKSALTPTSPLFAPKAVPHSGNRAALAFVSKPAAGTGAPSDVALLGRLDAALRDLAAAPAEWAAITAELTALRDLTEAMSAWQVHATVLAALAVVSFECARDFAAAALHGGEAVALHAAMGMDAATVALRVLTATALHRNGDSAAAASMVDGACSIILQGDPALQTAARCATLATGDVARQLVLDEAPPKRSPKRRKGKDPLLAGCSFTTPTEPLDAAAPFVLRAQLHLDRGDRGDALGAVEKALGYAGTPRPTLHRAHLLAARIARGREDSAAEERHLEAAVDTAEEDDEHGSAALLALFLHYRKADVAAAVPLYERAIRSSRARDGRRTKTGRRRKDAAPPPASGAPAAVPYGELLFNAAVCFEQHEEYGCAHAVEFYDSALRHLTAAVRRTGYSTGRVRLCLARALAGAGSLDRALEMYATVHTLVKRLPGDLHVDADRRTTALTLGEVHAHVGHCLASKGFDTAARPYFASALEQLQVRPVAVLPEAGAELGAPEVAGQEAQPGAELEDVAVLPSFTLGDDARGRPYRVTEWAYSGYGALLCRAQHFDVAVPLLEAAIVCAADRGDPAADAHLYLAHAYESTDRAGQALEVYEYVMQLPVEHTTQDQRYAATLRSASLLHYSSGDFPRAASLYLAALQLDPANPHTFVQAAWCLLQGPNPDLAAVQELYEHAITALEMARSVAPPEEAAQWDECYVLGECAVFFQNHAKRPAQAEELYRLALAAAVPSRNFAQVAANYAVLLCYELHKQELAEEFFAKALEAAGNDEAGNTAQLTLLYVDFLIHVGRHDQAVVSLRDLARALHGTAACGDVYHRLALIQGQQPAPDTATALFLFCAALGAGDTLLADAGFDTTAMHRRALGFDGVPVSQPREREDVAISADAPLEEVVVAARAAAAVASEAQAASTSAGLTAAHVRALVENATAAQLPLLSDFAHFLQYRVRDRALVEAAFEVLHERFPQELFFWLHYARYAAEVLRSRDTAMRCFRRALELDGGSVSVLDYFAEFLATFYPGRLDMAENCHLQSIARNPTSVQAHFCYATFLTHVSKAPQLAEAHFRRALELDPQDNVTLSCYATFLDAQAEERGPDWAHRHDAVVYAETMFREAIRLAPKTASHHVFFARFLWGQRRLPEAWSSFETALALDPHNALALRLAASFLCEWHQATPPERRTSNDAIVQLTEQLFRRALEVSSSDVLTLRSFARFFDEVKGDAASAASLNAAADAVEDRMAAGDEPPEP